VPLTIGELLDRRVLFPLSVCVGTVRDVGEGELVAKVCEISAIFADSDACKLADSNTASSILSSFSVAARILYVYLEIGRFLIATASRSLRGGLHQ